MTKKLFGVIFSMIVITLASTTKLMAVEGYVFWHSYEVTNFDNGGVFDLSISSGFDAFQKQSNPNYSINCGEFSQCPQYDIEVNVEDNENLAKSKLLEFISTTKVAIDGYVEGSTEGELLNLVIEPMQETIVLLSSIFADSAVTKTMIRSYIKEGKIANYIKIGSSGSIKDAWSISKEFRTGFVLGILKSALIDISVDIVRKTSGHIQAGIAWFALKHADIYITSNGNLIKIAVGEAMIATEAWIKAYQELGTLLSLQNQVKYSQAVGRLILLEIPYTERYIRATESSRANIRNEFANAARREKIGDSDFNTKIEEYIQMKLNYWDEDSREIREKKISELIKNGDKAPLEAYVNYWIPDTPKKNQCIAEFDYSKKHNKNRIFYDVEVNNIYYENIKFLKNEKVIKGYGGQDNGYFKPERDISQYEFSVMVCKLFYKVEFNNQSGYFNHLKSEVNDLPLNININNKNVSITRGEVAIILHNIMTKTLNVWRPIQLDEAKGWNKYSAYLRTWNIANGYNDGPKAGYYGINDNIRRDQTAAFLTRTYNVLGEK